MKYCGPGRPPKDMRYPVVQRWMEDRGMTMLDVARQCGIPPESFRYGMRSKNPGKRLIDGVLRVTGMKYEEAFREE